MNILTTRGSIRTLAVLGNHLPRRCGIAAFTTDLCDALDVAFPDLDCFVLAMNDPGRLHAYPERVRLEVAESDPDSYIRAADFLNVNNVDVVSVQHEFGIFGGKAGAHLFGLLRELRMPIVTTLHTIVASPTDTERAVMAELCALSERLVVTSANGADLLREVHGVAARKIDMIPHGIPALPAAGHSKDKLGLQGRPVILTFGLLSPDKGIENAIDALPAIAEAYPDVIYVVLGATHPHVKDRDGETYRVMLENRGHRLGVDENLIFHNRFVSHAELVQFLSAADICITPYLDAEQITSGTLALAIGSGKTVISTPYRYARELLADGRGVLVPWKDPGAIATEVIGLLADRSRRRELERRASAFGRAMAWPVVARDYMQTLQRATAEHRGRLTSTFKASTVAKRWIALPDMNLDHLRIMTDGTGVLQHAAWNVPRYEDGYSLDDNARALILLSFIEEAAIEPPKVSRPLATRYLAFVLNAFDTESGRFRNLLSYSRQWIEERSSEDSHGLALWALGTVVARTADSGRQRLARQLFHDALGATSEFTSPLAWAYTLLGAHQYFRSYPNEAVVGSHTSRLSEQLLELFQRSRRSDRPWFEDRLTSANARLPQALLVSGIRLEQPTMMAAGLHALEWLAGIQRSSDGLFTPVGSNGIFVPGERKADDDQRPIEVCGMISASLEAYRLTRRKEWVDGARRAFGWFLGENRLQQWVYDAGTGGCRDGLHADRVNENQGAESTVSFLMALMEMRLAGRAVDVHPHSGVLEKITHWAPKEIS